MLTVVMSHGHPYSHVCFDFHLLTHPNAYMFVASFFFASGGLPDKPPGFQLVLWDTNARINGLVATDLETLVSEVLSPFPHNAGFADGLFTMTTATDHKNNLNRFVLKRDLFAPCV